MYSRGCAWRREGRPDPIRAALLVACGDPAEILRGPRGGEEGPVTAELAAVPRLAAGTELLGEFKDSGYSQPPSLVRRADGQVIQMSRLLYLVASRVDGTRGPPAIADLGSRDLGRVLSGDQVRYLISAKLMPLGLIAGRGTPVTLPTASPLLALRAQGT